LLVWLTDFTGDVGQAFYDVIVGKQLFLLPYSDLFCLALAQFSQNKTAQAQG